jgi:hypothetical protein
MLGELVWRRRSVRVLVLRPTSPGPAWVFATVARRTYRRRYGWAEQDLALSAEGRVLVLVAGWRFVGWRGQLPLVDVVAEGSIPRPGRRPPVSTRATPGS